MDEGDENGVNFLDVKFVMENGKIIFDLYMKPTNSGRFLSYFSNHPIQHKKSVIIGQFNRLFWLSNCKFHTKNIKLMIETLLNNGYPLGLIFSTINNRINSLAYKIMSNNNSNKNNITDGESKTFFTIPYYNKISKKFKKLANKYKFNIAFKPLNKLDCLIKTGKGRVKKEDLRNVVYRINCQECDSSYVGQMKRKLRTRIREHMSDIKKSTEKLSVVSCHRVDYGHELDWGEQRRNFGFGTLVLQENHFRDDFHKKKTEIWIE